MGPVKEEAQIVLAEWLKDIRLGRNPQLRQFRSKPFIDVVKEFLEKHARKNRDCPWFVINGSDLVRLQPRALPNPEVRPP